MQTTNKKNGNLALAGIIFDIPLILLITAFWSIPQIKAGTLIGVLAYSFMLSNILFATQSSRIGATVGFKKIGLWHFSTGVIVLAMAIVHKLIMNGGSTIVPVLGNIAFWLLVAVFIFSFLVMSPLSKRFTFLKSINISRGFKVWIHRLNVIATLAIFFHVALNPFIRSQTIFIVIFYVISISVFGTYFYYLYGKAKKS